MHIALFRIRLLRNSVSNIRDAIAVTSQNIGTPAPMCLNEQQWGKNIQELFVLTLFFPRHCTQTCTNQEPNQTRVLQQTLSL